MNCPAFIPVLTANSIIETLAMTSVLCNIVNMNRIYKIKKSLKTPMIIATLISIPIFTDVMMRGLEVKMLIMALALMILFYLLTINNILRKVAISDKQVIISGILGSKRIPVEKISLIDGMTMGTRQFITISAEKKNHLIPNSFDEFAGIIDDLMTITPQEKHGASLAFLRENIVVRKSDITGAWITVILLAIIILIRYFPH